MAFTNAAFNTAANRAYYSIFHAMRSLLAIDGYDSQKHSGIISEFNRRYIKTGVFPVKTSEVIKFAFNMRGKSDYDDFYVISKMDVTKQIENAQEFLKAVEDYIDSIYLP